MKDNVSKCIANYDVRCRALLEREIDFSPSPMAPDAESHGLFAMVAGQKIAEGNAGLCRMSEWFDHPHRRGSNHRGECDFIALKLSRAFHYFREESILEEATLASIRRFFLERDFSSIYQSENHALIFHTSRYLMAIAYPEEMFQAYSRSGRELIEGEQLWLKHFLKFRARRGWGEFDSSCYMGPVWECLCCLFDFAVDAELKKITTQMMDLLLADMAVDSLNEMYCGAHGRIYPPHALDHSAEPTAPLQYLYFGLNDVGKSTGHLFLLDAIRCGYRPHPLVVDIALNRKAPYINRERKHLHNLADVLPEEPLQGSIRKVTYWTPEFALGSVVFQDRYPLPESGKCSYCEHSYRTELGKLHGPVDQDQRRIHEYAHHQQHEWDLSFGTHVQARIFTHHPGKDGTHNYWTGDRLCNCGHFFQNGAALIALYDISPDQPCQFIHAYLPRYVLDEVVEREGILFVRSGIAFAALILLSGYRWTVDGEWKDREVISDGARHGVVCEVGCAPTHRSFQEFQEEILGNEVFYDPQKLELQYSSKRAGKLWLDAKGERKLDHQAVDFNYATYDSPYIRSAWDSGVIVLSNGEEQLKLEF